MRLIGAGLLDGSAGATLEAVRGAGRPGRQLVTLARGFGLDPARTTGIYQAAGREKLARSAATFDTIRAHGFDSIRPAAVVFEHFLHGPFISLAIALECQGPFETLEAEGLAGLVAVATAAHDLEAGRCDQALVGAVGPPDRAFLLALGVGAPGLRAVARWGRDARGAAGHVALTGDLHGLPAIAEAIAAAQDGRASGVWAATADGRSLAVAFSRE